jgi:soluble lytic murein transglycosylase-like protein
MEVAALTRISMIQSLGFRGVARGVVGTPPRSQSAADAAASGELSASSVSAGFGSTTFAPTAVASPATTSSVDRSSTGDDLPAGTPYAQLFTEAGQRHGISPRLLAAVASVESSFDPTAVSPAGAQGLMQFMPSTADGMDVDPWDPASAIDGSARLLVGLQQRFGSIEAALAAYNVGSGTVARNGGLVPAAAQGYVDKVLTRFRGGVS